MLNKEQQQTLRETAKLAISYGLENNTPIHITASDYDVELQQQRASFVTLTINEQLRGCIGSLIAHQPLICDISHNAYAAAFSDPRFPALKDTEFKQLQYHLSILTTPTKMIFTDEDDFLSQLRPGIDGIILQEAYQQSTFLPAVWKQLPTTQEFMQQLKRKAGLPANYWSSTIQLSRYRVEEF